MLGTDGLTSLTRVEGEHETMYPFTTAKRTRLYFPSNLVTQTCVQFHRQDLVVVAYDRG